MRALQLLELFALPLNGRRQPPFVCRSRPRGRLTDHRSVAVARVGSDGGEVGCSRSFCHGGLYFGFESSGSCVSTIHATSSRSRTDGIGTLPGSGATIVTVIVRMPGLPLVTRPGVTSFT